MDRKEINIKHNMVDKRIISCNTEYGELVLTIKYVLIKKDISMYKLSIFTGIKYEIIYNYCNNYIQRYDKDVLAKICYVLDCSYTDLITYIPKTTRKLNDFEEY